MAAGLQSTSLNLVFQRLEGGRVGNRFSQRDIHVGQVLPRELKSNG